MKEQDQAIGVVVTPLQILPVTETPLIYPQAERVVSRWEESIGILWDPCVCFIQLLRSTNVC